MFGDEGNQSQDANGNPAAQVGLTHSGSVFPPVGTPAALPQQPEPAGPPEAVAPPAAPTPSAANNMTLDDLAAAVSGGQEAELPAPAAAPAPDAQPAKADDTAAPAADDLLDIKQKALQNLTPLVGKLEQTPLEKFKTTMMMIQASDDQSLIKNAYEAAEQIPDEKEKAQALLDIVNEINYFTQHSEE